MTCNTNARGVPNFRDFNFHALSDYQTDVRMMIAYGVKLRVTEIRNFLRVGIVRRLRELSDLMGI